MSEMIEFCELLLTNLPTFLMSEPICYFVALSILLWVVVLISRIFHL